MYRLHELNASYPLRGPWACPRGTGATRCGVPSSNPAPRPRHRFRRRVRRDHCEETAPLRFPVAWIGMRRLLLAPAGHEAAASEYSRYPATLLPVVIAIAAFLQAASAPAGIARGRGPVKVFGKYAVGTEVHREVHVGWSTGWVAPSCGVASARRMLCSGCAVPCRGSGPESAGG